MKLLLLFPFVLLAQNPIVTQTACSAGGTCLALLPNPGVTVDAATGTIATGGAVQAGIGSGKSGQVNIQAGADDFSLTPADTAGWIGPLAVTGRHLYRTPASGSGPGQVMLFGAENAQGVSTPVMTTFASVNLTDSGTLVRNDGTTPTDGSCAYWRILAGLVRLGFTPCGSGGAVSSVFGQTGVVGLPATTPDVATPSNPTSGTTWYTKAGKLCALDPSGNETCTGGAGGASDFKLLEQHPATASPELDFTTCLTSTYDTYQIELVSVRTGTSGANINLQVSTNGGTTYDTGSNYSWQAIGWYPPGSGTSGSTNTTAIQIFGLSSTQPNYTQNATIRLWSVQTGTYPQFSLQATGADTITGDPRPVSITAGAIYKNTTPINAFRIIPSSGNLASGVVRCYGLAK